MSALFLKILNMSVCASWIAAAVLVLRFCLKRAPKWVNVLLWGFVAARLICPVSIESALSLIPRADAISSAVLTAPGQTAAAPVIGGAAAAGAAANPLQTWIPILAWVWLAGVVVLFSVHHRQHAPAAPEGLRGSSSAGEHLSVRASRLTVRAWDVPAQDLSSLPYGQPRPTARHRTRTGPSAARRSPVEAAWLPAADDSLVQPSDVAQLCAVLPGY